MRVAVLGSGSWGTALAVLLARNGFEVALGSRDEDEIRMVNDHRENSRYLPGFAIPKEVRALPFDELEGDFHEWVVAVPSDAVAEVARFIRQPEPTVVIASKGIAPGTGELLCDVVQRLHPDAQTLVLSGPNLAVELMRGIPTASVIACPDEAKAEQVAMSFNCRTLRVYITPDRIGVSLAGALKNVLAISAGMSDGLGFGDNTKGALVARGVLEMTRLGVAMGAQPTTFIGVAGVGDLFATANSKLSRNYRVGFGIGEGRSLHELLQEIGQVAEGVPTADAATMLARQRGIQLPIHEMTQAVLRGHLDPRMGVSMLMERLPKREGWEELGFS